jgi:hypothetical protein
MTGDREMKNGTRNSILTFLFIFLLITPYEVLAHSPKDSLGGINSPWLVGQENPLEPGADYRLLGAFAAINGGFILFGAIRKLNKIRKSRVNKGVVEKG